VSFYFLRLSNSVCTLAQKDSIIALPYKSPIDPIDGTSPDCLARSVKAQEVNCTPWSEWMIPPAPGIVVGDGHSQSVGH
jgi:hypothetical protein